MRPFSLRIPASLAFALIATQAFAHAQLERRRRRSVERSPAEQDPARVSEGGEPKFTGVTLTSASGASVPGKPQRPKPAMQPC